MWYRRSIDGVLWPENAITVWGSFPGVSMRCFTPERRRSWTMRPVMPIALHAFVHSFRKSPMRRPFRWKT